MRRSTCLLGAMLTLLAIWGGAPSPLAATQERLRVVYSQFVMSNSVAWFAQEAGLYVQAGSRA